MRKRFLVVLLGLLILTMTAPAQAREHRSRHDRGPIISVRVNTPYYGYRYDPRYYRNYGTPIWTGLHQWQNEMRVNLAISSQAHNRSICERHLDRYGWDSVAETRCPAAGISYEDYLRTTRRETGPSKESSRPPEAPEGDSTPYTQPARPESESKAPVPTPTDSSELWLNMTGCPIRVDGQSVPPEGLRVPNPTTASVSVKSTSCKATDRKVLATGITGIVCR
jgi:hypothetical protein